MDHDIMVEVFREFYLRHEGLTLQQMQYACPKHYTQEVTFCEDFCGAVPILMEDNRSLIEDGYTCPCFAFGCEEAMARLQKFLAMEGVL